MAISNYQHGFKNGVTIRGVPVEITHPGRVFWVGNNATRLDNEKTSADGNDGSFLAPFATVMGAHDASAVVASRGDIIFVRPGYTETISSTTDWTISKAGVAIIGLGHGGSRPIISFDTTTDTINVSGANVAIRNFIFRATVDLVVSAFTLTTADELSIEDCFFQDNSATNTFIALVDTSAVANDCDGLYFARNVWIGLDDAAGTTPFDVDETQDRWTVIDNYLYTAAVPTALGMFDVAGTAIGLTQLRCTGNLYRHAGTDVTYGVAIGAVGSSHSTGIIANNTFLTLSAAASASIIVSAKASGMYRIANIVAPTSDAALRASELGVIRQAVTIQG